RISAMILTGSSLIALHRDILAALPWPRKNTRSNLGHRANWGSFSGRSRRRQMIGCERDAHAALHDPRDRRSGVARNFGSRSMEPRILRPLVWLGLVAATVGMSRKSTIRSRLDLSQAPALLKARTAPQWSATDARMTLGLD